MLHRNRIINKKHLDSLSLMDRIQMEAQITDTRAAKLDIECYRDIDLRQFTETYAWRRYLFNFLGDMRGKRVLDVGCGYKMTPVLFAMAGAEVVANDVAPLTLTQVRRVAEMHNVTDRIQFYCGPAEKIPYPDNSFDVVYGGSALHHLQIEAAGQELARVLRPGGRGGFQDPLGHNVILEFARDNLNYNGKHLEKGTDRSLKIADVKAFGSYFSSYRWTGFDMLAMITRIVPKLGNAMRILEAADESLFRTLPFLQHYARFVVILVTN